MDKRINIYFLSALLVALGIAAAGYFISETLYKSKIAINIAEVKGLSERNVEADQAYWAIGFKVEGKGSDNVEALYKKAEQSQNKIVTLLQENGFSSSEISEEAFDYRTAEFRDENNRLVDTINTISGAVIIQTNSIIKVSEARGKINSLIAQGIKIENSAPIYRFTKLNEIKPDMLKEAAENARIAANEFAKNAGVKVGKIREANQGGFQITDFGEQYSDTTKVNKTVRVVNTITFYLVD